MTALAAVALITSLLIVGCKKEETAVAASPATPTDAAPVVATAPTPRTPLDRPASPPSNEVIEPADGGAARATNLRVSFDAQGNPGVVAWVSSTLVDPARPLDAVYQNYAGYRPLYDYFLRAHAASVVEALDRVDHARLLAPRDEFESDAAHRKRLHTWLREVEGIFQRRVARRDYEVFGLSVPVQAASYDANARGWVVPFPTLPDIKDVLGRKYIAEMLAAQPDAQARLQSLPLVKPNVFIHPLRSEWSAEEKAAQLDLNQGRLFLPMADVDRARAFKERLQAGRVFYYLRFTPEMKLEWWGETSGGVSSADFFVILRPKAIEVYAADPPELLSAFTKSGSADLWFLKTNATAPAGGSQ